MLSDAGAVLARQETDSIDVVDEIRFHVKAADGVGRSEEDGGVQFRRAAAEIEADLACLDEMLLDIGFDV